MIHKQVLLNTIRIGESKLPVADVRPPQYGPGVGEPQKTIEINRRPTGGGTVVTAEGGAFYRIYEQDGDTYLQGGTVTGGGKTTTIADIKVVDATTGIESTEGFHLYVKAEGDGVVANGVLLGGWEMDTDAVALKAADVPDNTLPTAASHEGKLFHVDLGVFNETAFLPAASGNIAITFCPNGYNQPR